MKNLSLLYLSAIICLNTIVSNRCAAAPSSTAPKVKISEPYNEVNVTESANGKIQSLVQGDVLVVKLPTHQDGGYSWTCTKDSNAILQLGEMVYSSPASSGNIPFLGGVGTSTWRFLANSVGNSTLTFREARPWENTQAPLTTFRIPVAIIKPTIYDIQSKIDIRESDAGKQLVTRKGDILVVTLAANPTTGYTWTTAINNSGILSTPGSGIYQQTPTKTPLAGVGGIQVWTIKASQAGTSTLTFSYAKGKEQPAKTYSWNIIVTE